MSSKEFSKNKRSKEKLNFKLKEKDKLCLNNMLKKSENRSSRMMKLLNKLKLNTQKKEDNLNKNYKKRNNFLNISKV